MRCANQTIIELETAENAQIELKRHHRLIATCSVAVAMMSILLVYITLWCVIPFMLSALVLINSTTTLSRAEADIALSYIKALGDDTYLSNSRVPPTLLAIINSYIRIGDNANFKDIKKLAHRKDLKIQREIFRVIQNSKFRRDLGY